MDDIARILLYGLAAAASPTMLVATLVVLRSGHGRLNGTGFMAAFLVGQSAAFLAAFFVSSTLTERGPGRLATYLELAAGIALLVLAWRKRPPYEPPAMTETPRTEALFARLKGVTFGVAVAIGLVLGIGTKRLAITIIAATTVALAGLAPAEDIALSALYVVIATLVVWVPVSLYLLFGDRADELMGRLQSWVTTHTQSLLFASALVLGALFVLDATARLAG